MIICFCYFDGGGTVCVCVCVCVCVTSFDFAGMELPISCVFLGGVTLLLSEFSF
jgi:hypothetical protein